MYQEKNPILKNKANQKTQIYLKRDIFIFTVFENIFDHIPT